MTEEHTVAASSARSPRYFFDVYCVGLSPLREWRMEIVAGELLTMYIDFDSELTAQRFVRWIREGGLSLTRWKPPFCCGNNVTRPDPP